MHQNWHLSSLQSPAGCREQVRDQPGHLSKGAFCFHWHRRAGLPHHRRGQHGQRRCTNSSWCESRKLFSILICYSIFTSYPAELLQGQLQWTLLVSIRWVSYFAQPFCTQRSKIVILFLFYFLWTSTCLLSLFLLLTFFFPLSGKVFLSSVQFVINIFSQHYNLFNPLYCISPLNTTFITMQYFFRHWNTEGTYLLTFRSLFCFCYGIVSNA